MFTSTQTKKLITLIILILQSGWTSPYDLPLSVEEQMAWYKPILETKKITKKANLKYQESKLIDIRGVGDFAWTAPAKPKNGKKIALNTDVADSLKKIKYSKTLLKGDLSFINFEAVVGEYCDQIRPTVSWYFLSHPKTISSLYNYGFNLFSLANNHSQDCQNGRSSIKESKPKHGPLMTLESFENDKNSQNIIYAGVGDETEIQLNPFLVKEKFITIKGKEIKFAFASLGIFSWNIPNAATVAKKSFKQDQDLMQVMFPSFDQSNAEIKILSLHTQDKSGHNKAEDWAFLKLKAIAEYFIKNHGGNVVFGHGPHTFAGIKVLTNSRGQKSVIFSSLGNFIHQGLSMREDNYLGRVLLNPETMDVEQIMAMPLINRKETVEFFNNSLKTKINSNFKWQKVRNDYDLLIYGASL
ncbi:CapA family protein [Bacteriovoracaceae bacterium]|nr:CapA family protein [Bacteriovoracaceae bacterium]